MKALRGIARFCYEFVIGDDWKIATAVVLTLIIGALLALVLPAVFLAPLIALLLLLAFTVALLLDIR